MKKKTPTGGGIDKDPLRLAARVASGTERRNLREWSRLVIARDRGKCVFCFGESSLQAHHILPKGQWRKTRFMTGNGITVCKTCHLKIHTPRGFYGGFRPKR